ncbi:MAG TPA: hypothetical protein VHN58_06110 [Croceicoccus sp.]|nr:hypothetical protein [Croceicoccus sp.]
MKRYPFTPIPRASHARLTPEVQRAFIAVLAETGFVGAAALRVGLSVAALEKLRYARGAEGFRAAWDEARGSDSARRARRAARRGLSPRQEKREPAFRPDGVTQTDDPRQERRAPAFRPDEALRDANFSGSDIHPPLACRSCRPSRRTSYLAFTADPPDADDPLLGFAPYVHAQPRRNSITPDRQRAFIAALAATASVTQAAREIGASLEALYRLRARGGAEGFAKAWDKAVDCGMARLEDTALLRAIEGELRPVVSSGKVIAHYRRHNDALAMFMLRHRRAHRYGSESERRVEEEYDHDAIIASINRKIDTMRARMALAAGADDGGE